MQRRTGLTLVEVLVAIFIMGIGLIALLTLFPIGILRMAQAIRDEKAAQAAAAAHGYAKLLQFRSDPAVLSGPGGPDLFMNPLPGTLADADPSSESYAVYVDPVGYYSGNGAQFWVAGMPGYLPRQSVSVVPSAPSAATSLALLQYFRLWDDITFDPNFDSTVPGSAPGTPKIIAAKTPPTIQRDPAYSWAFLLRRPQTQDRSVVDCAIVVYDKRPGIGTGETPFQNSAYFDPNRNIIYLDNSVGLANVRAGDWLFDATHYRTKTSTKLPLNGPSGAHSYFYRVVAAEDVVGAGGKVYAKYEVQTPIRGFVSGASANSFTAVADPITGVVDANFPVYQGTLIVMERVIEVFEKGPVRLP